MNDDVHIDPEGCPVCGFQEITVLDSFGCTTFDICPSCGCESGYEYGNIVSRTHLTRVREHWLTIENGKWWSDTFKREEQPKNWSAIGQLLYANLPIPLAYKKSKKRNVNLETAILITLSRRVWNDFDPIGVVSSENDDEYNGYISATVKLIQANADKYKIIKYVENVVFINIGLENYPKSKIEKFTTRLAEITANYSG